MKLNVRMMFVYFILSISKGSYLHSELFEGQKTQDFTNNLSLASNLLRFTLWSTDFAYGWIHHLISDIFFWNLNDFFENAEFEINLEENISKKYAKHMLVLLNLRQDNTFVNISNITIKRTALAVIKNDLFRYCHKHRGKFM